MLLHFLVVQCALRVVIELLNVLLHIVLGIGVSIIETGIIVVI